MAQGNDIIGSNFLEIWRVNSTGPAAATSSSSADDPDSPTELNTLNSSGGFAIVGADKLSVRYPNSNLHGYDVGVVQANKPAPSNRMVFYFEIRVVNRGVKGQMSIGFTAPGFRMRRQPGYYGFITPSQPFLVVERAGASWEANSYGYHGDDGFLYRGHGKGEAFGPAYTTGDIVGGGINFATQEFFFTLNGDLIGKAYKDVKGPLYPTVAVHSQNEEVTVNFGNSEYSFKIKDYEAEERRKQQSKIDEVVIPQNASHIIVRSYLQHYGYEETLSLFDIAVTNSAPPINIPSEDGNNGDNMFDISQRKKLREVIRSGNIDDALAMLKGRYHDILEVDNIKLRSVVISLSLSSLDSLLADDKSAICFLLRCQKFIELIRENKPEEAMWYAKSKLGEFNNEPQIDDLVKDCVALLAYVEPQKSSVGYLLGDCQREIVADAVNAMILARDPSRKDVVVESCLHTRLEKLLRQLSACFALKRSLNGDEGEAFNLSRFLSTGN